MTVDIVNVVKVFDDFGENGASGMGIVLVTSLKGLFRFFETG